MIDVRTQFVLPQGRRPLPGDTLIGIAVHHSVTETLPESATQAQEIAALKAIEDYHVNQAGFGLFAYHLATFPSGRLYQIGNLDGQRSHVYGRNHQLVGFVNIGTFTAVMPGRRQMAANGEAVRLIRDHWKRYLPVRGHGLWALAGQGTACAGGPMNALSIAAWDTIAGSGDSAGEEEDMEYVRHNRIAGWFDGRELKASGADTYRMQAKADFQLPADAKAVQFAVWMDEGELSFYDGGSVAEAGRVGARGILYGVVQRANLGGDGTLNFRSEGPSKVGRIMSLGYWR